MTQPAAGTHLRSSLPGLPDGSLRRILGQLGSAVLVADRSGIVRYANRRAAELQRTGSTELIGRRIEDVLAPLDALIGSAECPREGDVGPSIEVAVQDGKPVRIGFRLSNVSGPTGEESTDLVAIVFRQIGEFERLRDERDRLLRLATVGDVLPSILHELKNPLASITHSVALLVEEAPPGALREDLHAILAEVRRMKLGFEGIGVIGRELHSTRNAAIDWAVREAFQLFAARAAQAGIELYCDVPDMPLLQLDPAVIRAILFNLVSNALHACESGAEIRVAAHLIEQGEFLEIRVEDTGPGMTTDVLNHCTDLFFTTKSSGSGIGLALCSNAAREAGGGLVVESEPGHGTRVALRLPVRPIDSSHTDRHARACAVRSTRNREGGRNGIQN